MIYIILFFACFIAFVTRRRCPILGFRIAIFCLFFLAAFQYGCSIDYWVPYKAYWLKMLSGTLDCEVGYKLLLHACRPFGFFAFSIAVQIINYAVYYYLMKKHCPKKYLWVSVILFALIAKHFLLFANCYRQTLAVSFSMLALDTLMSDRMWWYAFVDEKKRVLFSYLTAFLYIFVAGNIHATAYLCSIFLLYPVILKCKFVENLKFILVAFFSLYIGRNFVSSQGIAIYIRTLLSNQDNRFQNYMYQIQDNSVEMTFYLQMLYVVSMLAMCFNMSKLNDYQKSLTFSIMFGITLQPFLMTDSERLMMYLTIYWIILIPVLLSKMKDGVTKKLFLFLWIVYSVNSLFKNIGTRNYHNWADAFQLIFQAPVWL